MQLIVVKYLATLILVPSPKIVKVGLEMWLTNPNSGFQSKPRVVKEN